VPLPVGGPLRYLARSAYAEAVYLYKNIIGKKYKQIPINLAPITVEHFALSAPGKFTKKKKTSGVVVSLPARLRKDRYTSIASYTHLPFYLICAMLHIKG
jgi:hypothetical protein